MTNALKIGCGEEFYRKNNYHVICTKENMCPICFTKKDVLDDVREKIDDLKRYVEKNNISMNDDLCLRDGDFEDILNTVFKEILTDQDKTEEKLK
jgi:predicted DsbA family dithiol-disulfide isomerase